ncbi:hypothetical protein O6H91_01G061800 [Diphasiastrum complanatum]|uniref:Uncharacterized protein n=1 Tax=Diphasiastrum complanatum TaxID=34168 RepID=A0ACC2ERV4_DIPCM|nr:hypothetical protein O6H91_01G061800 [Diphasiastrum complanatum]
MLVVHHNQSHLGLLVMVDAVLANYNCLVRALCRERFYSRGIVYCRPVSRLEREILYCLWQSIEHLKCAECSCRTLFLVSVYAVLIQIVGFLVKESYLFSSSHALIALKKRNVDPSFFAFVFSFAAFSNSGLVFLNDNMVLFRESAPLLLSIIILILVGNTMF